MPARPRQSDDQASPPAKPCPVCGKPASATEHPFCSRRCADVDLNRWLGGVYAVPAADADEPDDGGAGSSHNDAGR